MASARRLFEIVDRPAPVTDATEPLSAPPSAHITLVGATLRHAPGAPLALDRVDLALPPGRKVAVVGPSGAGKSSIVEVLLRFRDLDAGEVLLGVHPAEGYASADVRRMVGVVDQDPHLFDATIEENLRLANPEATGTEIRSALRRAALDEWVDALPDGLKTPVGERGRLVSGGERRRLALARALLAGSPVLVLDEPTAHLDPPSARRLIGDLLGGVGDRSVLLITHDLLGVEAVDEVVVLDAGRVVQRGPHTSLVASPGPYRRLWECRSGAIEPAGAAV